MSTAIPGTFVIPTTHVCIGCSRHAEKVFNWQGQAAYCGECMSNLLAKMGY